MSEICTPWTAAKTYGTHSISLTKKLLISGKCGRGGLKVNFDRAAETGRLDACRKQVIRMIAAREISLRVTDDNGHQPVVVVDEHARLSEVIVQAARTGGFTNLFVLSDDGTVEVADLLPAQVAINPTGEIEFTEPLHRDIEIGMLLSAARQRSGGVSFPVDLPRQSGTFRSPRRLEDLAFEEV